MNNNPCNLHELKPCPWCDKDIIPIGALLLDLWYEGYQNGFVILKSGPVRVNEFIPILRDKINQRDFNLTDVQTRDILFYVQSLLPVENFLTLCYKPE